MTNILVLCTKLSGICKHIPRGCVTSSMFAGGSCAAMWGRLLAILAGMVAVLAVGAIVRRDS